MVVLPVYVTVAVVADHESDCAARRHSGGRSSGENLKTHGGYSFLSRKVSIALRDRVNPGAVALIADEAAGISLRAIEDVPIFWPRRRVVFHIFPVDHHRVEMSRIE